MIKRRHDRGWWSRLPLRPSHEGRLAGFVACGYLLAGVAFVGAGERLVDTFAGKASADLALLAAPGWVFVALTAPAIGLLTYHLARRAAHFRTHHELTFHHSLDGLMLTRADGSILMANPAACALTGYSEAELIDGGRRLLFDDSDPEVRALVERRRREGQVRGEAWCRLRDGRQRRVELSSALFGGRGEEHSVVCLRDVTGQHHAAYRDRLLDTVSERTNEGLAILDDHWRVLWANRAFETISQYPLSEIIGREAPLAHTLAEHPDLMDAIHNALDTTGRWTGELVSRRRDGSTYPIHGSLSRVASVVEGQPHYVASFLDMSELRHYEERLRQAARIDAITGLPNRFSMENTIDEALSAANPARESVALFLINLDGFSHVNQTFGHTAGDTCLRAVGERLTTALDRRHPVARNSSDSFFLLVDGIEATTDTAVIARRIRAAFQRPLPIDDTRTVALSVSVGISVFPGDGRQAAALMRAAEAALAEAKADGGDDYRYYTPDLEARARDFVSKTAQIRQGLRGGEFVAFFQPIVAAGSRHPVKFEALARWHHPTRGLLGPGEFIPVAERSGLIAELSETLLRQAAETLVTLDGRGWSGVGCTVNLSARQFRDSDLADRLARIVTEAGVQPDRIGLEVTETVVMNRTAGACRMIGELQARGFRVFMDDFGTGYSSLAYLKSFAMDGVKIDRSFVSGLPDDRTGAALVRAILAVARELDLPVVAEGIESDIQAEWLASQGCDMLQGFHFARPMPAGDLLTYLGGFEHRLAEPERR